MQALTPELKNRLKVEADKGVVLTEVVPDSPAAKAGLKPDDVITSMGDKAVANPAELRRAIQEAGPGKEVTLKFARGNDKREVKALLGEAPPEAMARIPRGEVRLPNINLERLMPLLEGGTRVEELERRVQQLEQRIQELEKKLEKK
jgi:predicted metalloprotease with PDZ domain